MITIGKYKELAELGKPIYYILDNDVYGHRIECVNLAFRKDEGWLIKDPCDSLVSIENVFATKNECAQELAGQILSKYGSEL